MSSEAPRTGHNPWDPGLDALPYHHPHRALQLVPYGLLAFGFMLTEVVSPQPGAAVLTMAGLCVLCSAWIFWWITMRKATRSGTGAAYGVFFIGLIPMVGLLVYISGWFGFFMVIGYGYAIRLPWRWRLAGIATMAAITALSQTGSQLKTTPGVASVTTYLAVFLVDGLAICGLAWFLRTNAVRSDEREDALTELGEANRKLEATLTENVGLHAQLLAQAREAGIHDERQRLAREIHDTLAQGLTGIITQLQAAEQASEDPARWKHHFSAAQTLARDSLAEARRSVGALRPESLESARLSDALTAVAARWQALHGIPVQVTTTGDERPLPPEAEFALLRAGQEALANVAKHARASRVGLTISYMEHEVALDVRDDGAGFDPAALTALGTAGEADLAGGHGFGLVAMRQRIEGLCGTLQVESEPGTGTAVSACIPVTPAGSESVPLERVLV
jgi:signal transduction histidine kinase